ncbi:MAG: hypothetical protein IJZ70_06720 [Bacteroidales bacterium]|nr:hypothetical protein [Bacteroidales bacterium]MBQ8811986.1 hypothetical protein [Bacteroidales bacterium]
MPLIPDIRISVQNQAQLILDPVVKGGQFQRSRNGQLLLYAGGFTAVFPVIINGEKWAFRCWHVPITDASKRLKLVSEFILNNKPSYLVPLEYTVRGIIVKGVIFPTTRMKWIEGKTIKKYLCENIGKKHSLLSLASTFLSLIDDMHGLGISHGDLQHGNILVTENEELFLVDYDSMYVPTMGNEYKDEIVGKEDYQHPKRKINKISSSKVDYFSELIIYLSIIGLAENPQLSTKYKLPDTEFLLFSATDFKDIEKSAVYKDLQSLNIPLVNHLLDMLSAYLKVDDINKLTPFNEDGKFKTLLSSYFKSEDDLWEEVKSADSIDAYQNYLKHYPRGRYNIVVRRKLNDLLEKQLIIEEDNLWKNAKRAGTISAYCHYISCSTKKTHLSEAKRIVDGLRWNVTLNSNTLEAYQRYLNETDLGLHRDEAYEKIDFLSWERASRLKTEHAYRDYLKTSVQKIHKFEAYTAINELLWNKAEIAATIEGYNGYLKKSNLLQQEVISSTTPYIRQTNPEYSNVINKIHDNQIRIKVRLQTLEEELWAKVDNENTKDGYELYLRQFPSGKHFGDCQRRIWEIQAQESEEALWKKAKMSHSLTGYRNYLKDSTLKKYQKDALEKISQFDDDAWAKACNVNSEAEYQKYIDTFPDAKNVQVAQQRIRWRKNKKSLGKFFKWLLAIVVISAIAIFAIKASYTSSLPAPKPTSVQTQQKSSSTSSNISQIESELDAKLKGLELQKKRGKALDINELNKAKSLLNKLYGKSSRYNSFKQRIDNL